MFSREGIRRRVEFVLFAFRTPFNWNNNTGDCAGWTGGEGTSACVAAECFGGWGGAGGGEILIATILIGSNESLTALQHSCIIAAAAEVVPFVHKGIRKLFKHEPAKVHLT